MKFTVAGGNEGAVITVENQKNENGTHTTIATALMSNGSQLVLTCVNDDGEITAITGENVRYLCPQKVIANGEEVSLYFRVLAPKKDVVIIARDGENVLYKRKAIKVNPGEIEKVTVNTSGIKELIVEVKEA